jgi:hypothetical protein
MVEDTNRSALDALRVERDQIERAIAALERASSVEPGKGRPRGRPRGKARTRRRAAGSQATPASGAKAPRGFLKEKVHQVLKVASKPLSGSELRDAVLKAGYPAKSSKNFYVQVYVAATRDPLVRKTREGFSLKGGCAQARRWSRLRAWEAATEGCGLDRATRRQPRSRARKTAQGFRARRAGGGTRGGMPSCFPVTLPRGIPASWQLNSASPREGSATSGCLRFSGQY